MQFTTVLFYVFAAVMVLAALRVITAKNPVHAALFLVLAFFNAAGIWLLLKAEFLAIVLVLVYVGAVMVLFLFVVMMLDINIDRMREGFWGYLPMASLHRRADRARNGRWCCGTATAASPADAGSGRPEHRRHQGTGPA